MAGQSLLAMSDAIKHFVRASIQALRTFEPSEGYYGCFSGGKDSLVIKVLSEIAGVKATWFYNMTTIDPPELTNYIKNNHADVIWNRPKHGGFFSRMVKKGFPTRRYRWCCSEYKEAPAPAGTTMIMGIRSAESPRRADSWGTFTQHKRTRTKVVSPIIKWPDNILWEFIYKEGIDYCDLYDEGFKRLGCIGCPLARKEARDMEFTRWPKYELAWKKGIQNVWDCRAGTKQRNGKEWFGSALFNNFENLWKWWRTGDDSGFQKCQGLSDFGGLMIQDTSQYMSDFNSAND